MKEKKKGLSEYKIKLIVMAVLTIFVAIAIPFVVKIVNNIIVQNQTLDNPTPPDTQPDEPPTLPTLTAPESITIDKLTTNQKFEYAVTDLGEYQVLITILDTSIATLDENNYIIPSAVGTTTIVSEINTDPKITKTTTLIVGDAVTDITYKISGVDNLEPNKLFVGKTYYLQITENGNLSEPPNLGFWEEFISNFTFINKTDNISTYSFCIIKPGNFNFYYNGKYCQKYINLTSFVYPTDINVNFSNIIFDNNITNLYLYNKTHENIANTDGYFDNSEFEICLDDDVYDDITYEISGSSIVLDDNKICAIATGKSNITFTSMVSGLSKTFEFNVYYVEPSSIKINSNTYSIGETIALDLKVNSSVDFAVDILPIYAYGEIDFDCSNNVLIDNGKLTLTNASDGFVKTVFNNSTILTCNINFIPEYEVDISLYAHSGNVELNNDTITINLSSENTFLLNCKVINTSTNQPENIELLVEILNTSIITASGIGGAEIKNEILSLLALNVGSTKIIFTNTEFDIYYELKIEISN